MSEEMATSISDLRRNFAEEVEEEFDNQYNQSNVYQPNIVPQTTMQSAPPMRFGKVDDFQTHRVHQGYPTIPAGYPEYPPPKPMVKSQPKKSLFDGFFDGLYLRLMEPLILVILFALLSHRMVAKSINPYLPFVSDSPSIDMFSLLFRGFIMAVLFLVIRRYMV